MKTKPYVLLIVVLMMAACQPKIETKTVDVAADENAVITILDNLHEAMNTGNVNNLKTLLDNEGLYCGTDPEELWDKETLTNVTTETLADSSFTFDYSIDKRKIRVAVDGSTALVLEQFTMSAFSEKIPIRCISHLVKTDENWKIDFVSWSFIPINEDIAKLNEALE